MLYPDGKIINGRMSSKNKVSSKRMFVSKSLQNYFIMNDTKMPIRTIMEVEWHNFGDIVDM